MDIRQINIQGSEGLKNSTENKTEKKISKYKDNIMQTIICIIKK